MGFSHGYGDARRLGAGSGDLLRVMGPARRRGAGTGDLLRVMGPARSLGAGSVDLLRVMGPARSLGAGSGDLLRIMMQAQCDDAGRPQGPPLQYPMAGGAVDTHTPKLTHNHLKHKRNNGLSISRIITKLTYIPFMMGKCSGNKVGNCPYNKRHSGQVPAHQRKTGPLNNFP